MVTETRPPVSDPETQTPTTTPNFDGDRDAALQWLEDIALVTGMSDQKLEHIRRIGDCDGQVDQRIGVLCQVLEIDRSALGV